MNCSANSPIRSGYLLAVVLAAAAISLLLYNTPSAAGTQTASAQTPSPSAVPFCQRDFAATAKRRDDIAELEAAGGLVHLLAREAARAPFECAAFYLSLGLDVNAVGRNGLTALHYAIQVNSPEMVRFVIVHGADLHKKAGAKQLAPMGYAFYLALTNPEIDRNRVIAILNDALAANGQ